jgi:hypothetical protein
VHKLPGETGPGQIQHQQRHGDSKYAVDDGVQPTRTHRTLTVGESVVLYSAGNVNTTVHLQDTTPNASYYVVLYDQNCAPQHMLDGTNPVVSTDAQGNGTMSFASHDPERTMTSAQVQLFHTADWSPAPLDSPQVHLS